MEKSLCCHVRNGFVGTRYGETKRRCRPGPRAVLHSIAPSGTASPYAALMQIRIRCPVQVDTAAAPLAIAARCPHRDHLAARFLLRSALFCVLASDDGMDPWLWPHFFSGVPWPLGLLLSPSWSSLSVVPENGPS